MIKPTVHYRGDVHAVVGEAAWLHPVDHPNHLPGHDVSNKSITRTSMVVAYDKDTGRVETQNTVYMPEVVA